MFVLFSLCYVGETCICRSYANKILESLILVTSITRPATGRAQPEPTPGKRQKETGPGDRGLPGDIYHYIDIDFHAYPYSHVYIYAETTIIVSDICYDNYQRIRQN